MLPTTFSLTPDEQLRAQKFIKAQEGKEAEHPTAIGGRFSFRFTPTGIGTIAKIVDSQTNEETVLTDLSML